MLPGHDGHSNIVYDEAGTVHCYDRTSQPMVRHPMAYIGHEPQRKTLKYRCPARHEGWTCPHDPLCNPNTSYGKTVRIKQEIDLRRFPPIPRATKKFERMYKGRTAVERVNARLKVYWGADDGNIRGSRRFHAFVGAVLIVHIGLATLLAGSPRRGGTLGKMRGWAGKALAVRAEPASRVTVGASPLLSPLFTPASSGFRASAASAATTAPPLLGPTTQPTRLLARMA
ncbi:MAG: hypothetical protein ABSF26_28645 [Thermoguttaceae bacterium]